LLTCCEPMRAGLVALPKKKRMKGLVMRKLFLMLAVLLLASAAYATDVTISCAQVGDTNEVIVSYVASKDVNIPRGMGLDIQLNTADEIHDVTLLDTNYWVHPGTYGDTNDLVADPCDSGDTLPGEGSNGVTVELGSLHSPPEVTSPNAPAISNDLLSFTVTTAPGSSCNVSIAGNAARGKVVFYDATNEDDAGRSVTYTGCTVTIPPDGCPTCVGDTDRNTYVYIDDYQAMLILLLGEPSRFIGGPGYGDDPRYDPCYDMDSNNYIYIDDYQALLDALLAEPSRFYYCPGYP